MKPGVGGDSANELSVQVGQQHVSFTLEPKSTSSRRTSRSAAKVQKTRREKLRLQIKCWDRGQEVTESWEDTDTVSLETQLANVVDALIVTGERLHREGIQHHYNWLVQRKTDMEEKERQQQAEQVRLEQERRQQREQARIDRLLTDASALRQAGEIRSYVDRVVNSVAAEGPELLSAQLDSWVTWAIAQADRIDPVRSGRFIEAMQDPAED